MSRDPASPVDITKIFDMMSVSIDSALADLATRDIYSECLQVPTAFENWIGAVESLKIPTPNTIMIPCPKSFTMEVTENMSLGEESKALVEAVSQAVRTIGDDTGYPVFIKNSFTSDKHDWLNSCCIHDAHPDVVRKHIASMAYHNAGGPHPYAGMIVVREMLKTNAAFYAFNGMPITPEFRLFATDGKVEGYQPYWPEEAFDREPTIDPERQAAWDKLAQELRENPMQNAVMIAEMPQHPPSRVLTAVCEGIEPCREQFTVRHHNPLISKEDRTAKLNALKQLSSEDLSMLIGYAEAVTEALGGYWSVDFLQDVNGKWWLIDMAEGNLSFKDQQGFVTL